MTTEASAQHCILPLIQRVPSPLMSDENTSSQKSTEAQPKLNSPYPYIRHEITVTSFKAQNTTENPQSRYNKPT